MLTTAPDFGDAGLPQWYQDLQSSAWEASSALPLPKRTDEPWRFGDLKRTAALEAFQSAASLDEATVKGLIARSSQLEETSGKFVFANESLAHADRPAVDGLICLPLAEAVEKHAQLLQEHFMTQDATLGSEKFAQLHKSRTKSGLFIYVPAGVEIALPIEAFHWVGGANASMFPHTLIVTGENSKVTVVDYYGSASDLETGLACGVVDLVAGRGSKLRYVACQSLSPTSSNIHISSTLASADADVKSLQVQIGSAWSRTESVSHLSGKGANSDMLSVSAPSSSQQVDQRTLQHHGEAHTTSDLLYKNALNDKSRSVLAGLIMVDEGAHYTDAYQTCRNLLLSDEAEANSMPGLEINADQVKCSHGSTSGPITEEDVFYFNARGIPTDIAKQLITYGFAAEVFGKLRHEAIEAMVGRLVEEKFSQLS
ncbi:MAG: Fe-S cluster assembly protein SufD [Verrucomicrobiaceae bacterium]|nr:Fe-S cluster assembly protein SufD [Verrucomicrobiaceae bacterium]